jgi:hypothetical protein
MYYVTAMWFLISGGVKRPREVDGRILTVHDAEVVSVNARVVKRERASRQHTAAGSVAPVAVGDQQPEFHLFSRCSRSLSDTLPCFVYSSISSLGKATKSLSRKKGARS